MLRRTTLLAAHLTEPGLLPTLVVEDGGEFRQPRVSTPQGYWPMGCAPAAHGQRAGRADVHLKRVVVLNGEQHSLKDFRGKVCRETEMAVENFDHFCPWVGNVRQRLPR